MRVRERYKRLTFWNKVAFWGSIASIISIPIGFLFFYLQTPSNKDRPNVFFKMTRLSKPLTVGEKTTVELIIANSGQMIADGFFKDMTYYFDVDPPEQTYEYQKNEPITFSLSPTEEWNGQMRFSFMLTKEKIAALNSGRAHLYFYGKYRDTIPINS